MLGYVWIGCNKVGNVDKGLLDGSIGINIYYNGSIKFWGMFKIL